MTDSRDDGTSAGSNRQAMPADDAEGEAILSEGVGGVPEEAVPERDRATVGDADDDNVDAGEGQMEPNR